MLHLLTRNPYFGVYYRQRWGFGHSTVWRYIAAAQVHKTLATVPGMPMPDCEAQIRPLVGLSADLAVQAWVQAIGWSRDACVAPVLVKRSVKQLLKTEPPGAPKPKANRQQRYETRRAIKAGIQELLTVIVGRPDHAGCRRNLDRPSGRGVRQPFWCIRAKWGTRQKGAG